MEQTTLSTLSLDRLLTHINANLTSTSGEAKLRSSQYERTRAGANLEHARALLLTLEKQTSSLRVQTQRQQLQSTLQQRREQIKALHARLRDLDRSDSDSDFEYDSDADEEDLLTTYGPARTDADAGIEAGEPQAPRISSAQTNELRARRPPDTTTPVIPTATTTSNDARPTAPLSSSSAREQLFAARPTDTTEADPGKQTTEMLMSHNRVEQEDLTSGLLALAKALKESSLSFASSLEADKDVLKRAEGGLDKSAVGMETAERKMSTLRRMSEGQGWWGRIKLYGFIFGLWVACFLLVLVGPKLRF